jgi:FlaA1/EpsC-like NDP-sugar epimerase
MFAGKIFFDNFDAVYLLSTILIYFLAVTISKSQQVMWIYAGTKNYLRLISALLISSTLNIIASALFFNELTEFIGERFAILYNITFFLWVICSRMSVRGIAKMLKINHHRLSNDNMTNVIIIGAGDGGSIHLHNLSTNSATGTFYNIVGFIDSDPKKKGAFI